MTVIRPRDYGDQFPSDLDDEPPLSPLFGFSEADYSTAKSIAADVRARPLREGTLDLAKEKPDYPKTDSFRGIVSSRIGDGVYLVYRRDGKLVEATVANDEKNYNGFLVGDIVTVNMGEDGQTNWMSGGASNFELGVITATLEVAVGPTNTPRHIPVTSEITLTGDSFEIVAGNIKCTREDVTLTEVSYSVTVRCVNPVDENKGTKISVKQICTTVENHGLDKILPAKIVAFNKKVGFIVGWDQSSEEAQVSMNIGETDYVPQSPSGGGEVIWTDGMEVGNYVKVGSGVAQGWIRICSNGGSYAWLGHGDKALKMRMPNNDPSQDAHLFVYGFTGEAVQLKWTKSGLTGTLTVYEHTCPYGTNTTKEYKFEQGIIVQGPGFTAGQGTPVAFTETERKVWDPC